jgi:ribonucleoside-diphosphate reductase alpha chain
LIPLFDTHGKGTIGILAGTTTGIEPLFAVAYKRRYLKGTEWHYQYVVDSAAEEVIERYRVDPESIESALDLAADPGRRIKFQADVQDFVDQSISSTITSLLGALRGTTRTTCAGSQPLSPDTRRASGASPVTRTGAGEDSHLQGCPTGKEAQGALGVEFKEHDICEIGGKGGVCGV